jgi:hypothetical protein
VRWPLDLASSRADLKRREALEDLSAKTVSGLPRKVMVSNFGRLRAFSDLERDEFTFVRTLRERSNLSIRLG